MLLLITTVVQTDAQAFEGLVIVGILVVFCIGLAIWAKNEDEKENSHLYNHPNILPDDEVDDEVLKMIKSVKIGKSSPTSYIDTSDELKINLTQNGDDSYSTIIDKKDLNPETLDKLKRELEEKYNAQGIEIDVGFNISHEDFEEKRSRHISQQVKDKVWRRDGGKCVECDSNENLEFDHIIPFSKGGANTYRNLQLLCENCNRSKSDKIG